MTVDADGLALTAYPGERARAPGGGFLADAITEVFARHPHARPEALDAPQQQAPRELVRTDRLLTLSEDLPLVSVAVDARERIEAAHAEVAALGVPGLLTLERARLVRGDVGGRRRSWGTRRQAHRVRGPGRARGRAAYEAVVAALHARGVAGASVLLGVDGTFHGERRRARFLGGNAAVPMIILAVGASDRIPAVLSCCPNRCSRSSASASASARDGVRPPVPLHPEMPPHAPRRAKVSGGSDPLSPAGGAGGLTPRPLQKLMVYAGEQSRYRGAPLSPQLVRVLLAAGAAGATSLRGVWGYHGDHAPHGDTLRQLRRRVPVVTVVVHTPERIAAFWLVVDAHTSETGLVTSDLVPVADRGARGNR